MKYDGDRPLYTTITVTTFEHPFYTPSKACQTRHFSMTNTLSRTDLGVFHILPDVPCLETISPVCILLSENCETSRGIFCA